MVQTAGFSDCGGREYNEDSYIVVTHGNIVCAVVADGLGGHGGGKEASAAAVNTIKECIEEKDTNESVFANDIHQWFNLANDRVLEMQAANCKMKTTMALVCFEFGKDAVLSAHLGDTRIYHFVDGKLAYMSFDHSVSRMAVLAGEITMEEIRFHTDRNRLLKAVGNDDEVAPEIKELPLGQSHKNAFLICTDGFWEYVTEAQMEETLLAAGSPKEWLGEMRSRLLEAAKEGNDNNTAIAVFL